VNEITTAGLQGRGGAGFPAGLKMRFTAAGAKGSGGKAYVVCNADESEPGTFKDRILIDGDPHHLLEAMAIAGYAIGAHEGYIYIRASTMAQRRCSRSPSATRRLPVTWVTMLWVWDSTFISTSIAAQAPISAVRKQL